ncbi:hypothetical protein KR093_006755, partial [Drosophila rubida]
MDDDINTECLPPVSTNTFAIPNEPALLGEYVLYKASLNTQLLPSECHREAFAEVFIEHERLGTLADLCVRALAKLGTRYIAPPVKQDPLKLRIHYDSLDVNLPLRDCYFVEDLRFWRRVVLAKSSDKSLVFKKLDAFDWRGKGISLKYVELVEACPAAYWPEKQMAELGALVRQYVTTMRIKHLQSMTESSFAHYVESEPELDVTSDESDPLPISSDECDTIEEEEAEEEQESEESVGRRRTHFQDRRDSVRISVKQRVVEIDVNESVSTVEDVARLQARRREARQARNAARQQLRDFQQEKRMEHIRRMQTRAQLRKKPDPPPPPKRKKKKKIKGVFDIAVPPEPEDNDDEIVDKRNKKKLLDRIHRYDYPAKHCHHIDLSFVRYFDMLESLTIEFLGPEMQRDYHKRHLNFSYNDMVHLAMGLATLQQLKTFRLRNSRMDSMKLLIIARVLKQLNGLEVVDFSYDQLPDDSNVALEMLLDRRVMLKKLELEYNNLGKKSVESIGYALKCYSVNDRNAPPLQYLSLAHNPLGETFIQSLIHSIANTNHVEELNINGAGGPVESILRDVCHLLRQHAPLRRLSLAGINLQDRESRELICSLCANENVVEFDCRGCELEEDEEYEADVIARRNKYVRDNAHLAAVKETEEAFAEYLSHWHHPIVNQVESKSAVLAECIKWRTVSSSSSSSVEEEEQVEHQEQEYDIWKALGVNTIVSEHECDQVTSSTATTDHSFVYSPSLFNLDQVREYMHLPGPADRYYYFQKQVGRAN